MSDPARPGRSSYLRWLPAALWRDESPDAAVSLGATLRIFEKLLTGIQDEISIEHAGHRHPSFAAEIGGVPELFGAWTAPAEADRDFLAALASWVALDFAQLSGRDLWDEYQRRNATAKIAGIYRHRGLKSGLSAYLDLYAVGSLGPRVSIDDGTRILAVVPEPDGWASVCGLVTQGPVLAADGRVVSEGLMRPCCLAVGPDGSIFAGESPLPLGIALPGFRSRVWRFTPSGEYRYATTHPETAAAALVVTAPRRYPLAPTSLNPVEIRAVAVAPPRGPRPETTYVLEPSGRVSAVPAPYARVGTAPVTPAKVIGSVAPAGGVVTPVAMAIDSATGELLILERGSGPGSGDPPKIVRVAVDPFTVTRTSLTKVVEPLSLYVETGGALLIGDGGEQEPASPEQLSGNLVRVDRTTAPWTETVLLPGDNPLRAPTGIARTADGRLYVLDAGLKPFRQSEFTRPAADPAYVFALDEQPVPRLSRLTPPGSFVYPVGMVASGDQLLVADRGETSGDVQMPSWTRIKPFQFDLVLHWAEPRLPPDDVRHDLLGRLVFDLSAAVEEQKPAHTVMNLVTQY